VGHLCSQVLEGKLTGEDLEKGMEETKETQEKITGAGADPEAGMLGTALIDMQAARLDLAKAAELSAKLDLIGKKSAFLVELQKVQALARECIEILDKTGFKAESKALSDLLEAVLADNAVTADECESLRDAVKALARKMEVLEKPREMGQIDAVGDQLDILWQAALQQEVVAKQQEAKALLQAASAAALTIAAELEQVAPEEGHVMHQIGKHAESLSTWTIGAIGDEVGALLGDAHGASQRLGVNGQEAKAQAVETDVVPSLQKAADADQVARSVLKTLEKKEAEAAAAKARANVAVIAKLVAKELQASPNKDCQRPVLEIEQLGTKVGDGELTGEEMDRLGESVRSNTSDMVASGCFTEAQAVDKLATAVGVAAKAVIDVEVLEKEKQARKHVAEAKSLGEGVAKSLFGAGHAGAAHSVNKVLSHLHNASEGAFMLQVRMDCPTDDFNKERYTSELEEKLKVKRGRMHTRGVRSTVQRGKPSSIGKSYIKTKDLEPGQRAPSPMKGRALSPDRASSPSKGNRATSPTRAMRQSEDAGEHGGEAPLELAAPPLVPAGKPGSKGPAGKGTPARAKEPVRGRRR